MNTTNFDILFLAAQKSKQFTNIINDWGVSSVMLKKYLKQYEDNFSYGYAEKLDGININYILRYTNKVSGMLHGDMAVYRLKIAMLAKAYIMNELGDLEDYQKFINECLHLYLRINSLRTNYSFGTFRDNVFDAYNKIYNADAESLSETKRMLLEHVENYKPRRKQTLYHYCLEDFANVSGIYTSYKDAYNAWVKYYFPTILENYKKKTMNEYKQKMACSKLEGKYLTTETYLSLLDKKQEELDNIKINLLSEKSFKTIVCRLYKKNNMENDFIVKKEAKKIEEKKAETKKIQIDYSAMLAADSARFMEEYNKRQAAIQKLNIVKQPENIEEKKSENKILSYAEQIEQSRQAFQKMYSGSYLMSKLHNRLAI